MQKKLFLVETMNDLNRTFGGSDTRKELVKRLSYYMTDYLAQEADGTNTYGPTALHE